MEEILKSDESINSHVNIKTTYPYGKNLDLKTSQSTKRIWKVKDEHVKLICPNQNWCHATSKSIEGHKHLRQWRPNKSKRRDACVPTSQRPGPCWKGLVAWRQTICEIKGQWTQWKSAFCPISKLAEQTMAKERIHHICKESLLWCKPPIRQSRIHNTDV